MGSGSKGRVVDDETRSVNPNCYIKEDRDGKEASANRQNLVTLSAEKVLWEEGWKKGRAQYQRLETIDNMGKCCLKKNIALCTERVNAE